MYTASIEQHCDCRTSTVSHLNRHIDQVTVRQLQVVLRSRGCRQLRRLNVSLRVAVARLRAHAPVIVVNSCQTINVQIISIFSQRVRVVYVSLLYRQWKHSPYDGNEMFRTFKYVLSDRPMDGRKRSLIRQVVS